MSTVRFKNRFVSITGFVAQWGLNPNAESQVDLLELNQSLKTRESLSIYTKAFGINWEPLMCEEDDESVCKFLVDDDDGNIWFVASSCNEDSDYNQITEIEEGWSEFLIDLEQGVYYNSVLKTYESMTVYEPSLAD